MQIPRCSHAAIGARLAQFDDRLDQHVDLFLLANDDFVELIDLVFSVAGFDFKRSQALLVVAIKLHKALRPHHFVFAAEPFVNLWFNHGFNFGTLDF